MNDKQVFYKNEKEEIKYNPLCEKCPYECKQSFRAQIWSCRYTKEQKLNKKRVK